MDGLEQELKLLLLRHCTAKCRRLFACRVCKQWHALCAELLVVHDHVRQGWLPVMEGRAFSAVLDLGRYTVNDQGLFTVPGIKSLDDVSNMRAQGRFVEQSQLTAHMYTHFRQCHKAMLQCELGEGESRGVLEKALRDAESWGTQRITGTFFVLCVRPDGTILVSEDLSRY
jgi:hypothetical protein